MAHIMPMLPVPNINALVIFSSLVDRIEAKYFFNTHGILYSIHYHQSKQTRIISASLY